MLSILFKLFHLGEPDSGAKDLIREQKKAWFNAKFEVKEALKMYKQNLGSPEDVAKYIFANQAYRKLADENKNKEMNLLLQEWVETILIAHSIMTKDKETWRIVLDGFYASIVKALNTSHVSLDSMEAATYQESLFGDAKAYRFGSRIKQEGQKLSNELSHHGWDPIPADQTKHFWHVLCALSYLLSNGWMKCFKIQSAEMAKTTFVPGFLLIHLAAKDL